jgi:hypothetical protein
MTTPIQKDAGGIPSFFAELPPIPENLRVKAPPRTFPDGLTEEIKQEFIADIKKLDTEAVPFELTPYSFGAWSPSKLKSLQKCQWQFYLKYILKYKIPEQLQSANDPVSANVGKAAHQILEYTQMGKKVEDAYKKTKVEYVDRDKNLTEEQWVELVDTLHYNIVSFNERIEALSRNTKIRRVMTELKIAITKDYEPTGFMADDAWLRGVVDLIFQLENGDIIIIDHKTGGGEGSPLVYRSQLDWYKVLFHYGIENIEGAQTGIHFIRAGEIKMVDYSDTKQIQGNLKNTLEMSIEGAIDTVKEKGYFKHVRGGYCKWCEYDNVGCKSGELKPTELGTKKWFAIKPV